MWVSGPIGWTRKNTHDVSLLNVERRDMTAAEGQRIHSIKPKRVIGLVGGIGSGKSRVAEELRKCGAAVISGDRLGHEALRQAEIKERVVQQWGGTILDAAREVDRKRLGAIVFADANQRRLLETIVFPWIEKGIGEEIALARKNESVKFIVLDAAILLEAGWSRFCDRVLFVDAPREVRLQRLAGQRGWNEKEVTARENAQMPLAEKKSRADAIIDNSGTPEELTRQVEDLLHEWGIAERG
jgi:dephospho-CoA kinase